MSDPTLPEAERIVETIEREIATRKSHFGNDLDDESVAARRRYELPYWQWYVDYLKKAACPTLQSPPHR